MAIKTLEERLEIVQDAIIAIESGAQEYTIGDRTFKRGDLKALHAQEKYLEGRVTREAQGNGGGIRVRGGSPAHD